MGMEVPLSKTRQYLTCDAPYDESNFPKGELPTPTLSSIGSVISEKEASGAFPESNLHPCEILLEGLKAMKKLHTVC